MRFQKRIAKRQGLAIELGRATITSPHCHEEQSVLMTSVSIPGIYDQSKQYYPSLLSGFGLCHRGGLGGLGQLPVLPMAHQYGIGARQLCVSEAALVCPTAPFRTELFISRFH